MEEINKIEVNILEGIYFPKLYNHGQMIDDCKNFNYVFEKGKAYGIIGECGSGGWGLSYNLVGKKNYNKGYIKVNDKTVGLEELKQISCYVCESMVNNSLPFKNKSILKQLKDGVKTNKSSNLCVEDVIKTFNLSKDRLHLKVEELSWERWRASIAIGYSYGRKLFCFPWVDTRWINDAILNFGLHICIDILKNNGAIIIIPTEKAESVEFIVDEIIHLNNDRHLPSKRAREFVEEYKKTKYN